MHRGKDTVIVKGIVVSLYDFTAEAVIPWAQAGYECHCWDIKHDGMRVDVDGGGCIKLLNADLQDRWNIYELIRTYATRDVVFGMAFPVCTDLAVSGAKHFAAKAKVDPMFQSKAVSYAVWAANMFEALQVPYFLENPVSVLATKWGPPDYYFHPYEYGGYIENFEAVHPRWPQYIPPFDAYSKKTCLWTSDDFIMPEKKPIHCDDYGKSPLHKKLGGKSERTKMIRSATPRGFAKAVFLANVPAEGEA